VKTPDALSSTNTKSSNIESRFRKLRGCRCSRESSARSTSTSTSTTCSQHGDFSATAHFATSHLARFLLSIPHSHSLGPILHATSSVRHHIIHRHRSIVSEERLASRRLGTPATPYLPTALASGPTTPASYSSPSAFRSSNKDENITATAPRATASRHILHPSTVPTFERTTAATATASTTSQWIPGRLHRAGYSSLVSWAA